MKWILIAAILVLSGCNQIKSYRVENHHNECAEYGFVKGTTEYGNCMLVLEQNYQKSSADRKLAIQNAVKSMKVPDYKKTYKAEPANVGSNTIYCNEIELSDQVSHISCQ